MSGRDGGDAFPADGRRGMSLRDYFAGQALEGFMANKSRPTLFVPEDDAKYFYALADAMLAERSKK